jgi:hypothetical protein
MVLIALVLIFLLVWLAVGLELVPAISHANARHGGDADTARLCNSAPNMHLFYNPTTQRSAKVCLLDGKFGIVITDAMGREVTAFLKNKMTRFTQVVKYLSNQGYQMVQ